ncbi:hypothetical protein FKM82_012324 [Ascaphus truei]
MTAVMSQVSLERREEPHKEEIASSMVDKSTSACSRQTPGGVISPNSCDAACVTFLGHLRIGER